MKKTVILLTAMLLACGLTGCGGSDDPASPEASKAAESVSEVADSKAESAAESSETVSCSLANDYYENGYMFSGDMPAGFDSDTVEGAYKDNPMTIKENGEFEFLGNTYQLIEAGEADDTLAYAVKDSGFDLKKYQSGFKGGDADYEGPCAFLRTEQHMQINGEDSPYIEYHLIIKGKGDEGAAGYYSFSDEHTSFDF